MRTYTCERVVAIKTDTSIAARIRVAVVKMADSCGLQIYIQNSYIKTNIQTSEYRYIRVVAIKTETSIAARIRAAVVKMADSYGLQIYIQNLRIKTNIETS